LSVVTEREQEILELVRAGNGSPSELAVKLGISQPGASQALQRLATKGRLLKRKTGRSVRYDLVRQGRESDLAFLFQAYNALSQVWAFIMSMGLPKTPLPKARNARDTLEKVLSHSRK